MNRKFTNSEKLLFLSPLLFLAIFWVFTSDIIENIKWKRYGRENPIENEMSYYIEWNARNCGYAAKGNSNENQSINSCVVQAFRARKPFRVHYQEYGLKPKGEVYIVGNSKGVISVFFPVKGANGRTGRGAFQANDAKIIKRDGEEFLKVE